MDDQKIPNVDPELGTDDESVVDEKAFSDDLFASPKEPLYVPDSLIEKQVDPDTSID